MKTNVDQQWDRIERRRRGKERRLHSDRRSAEERRFDYRQAQSPPSRSIKARIRSLIHARLGVDRRKKETRRIFEDRRSQRLRSLLTPEELSALLQD